MAQQKVHEPCALPLSVAASPVHQLRYQLYVWALDLSEWDILDRRMWDGPQRHAAYCEPQRAFLLKAFQC